MNRWRFGGTSGAAAADFTPVGTNLPVSLHLDGAVVQPQLEEAARVGV